MAACSHLRQWRGEFAPRLLPDKSPVGRRSSGTGRGPPCEPFALTPAPHLMEVCAGKRLFITCASSCSGILPTQKSFTTPVLSRRTIVGVPGRFKSLKFTFPTASIGS